MKIIVGRLVALVLLLILLLGVAITVAQSQEEATLLLVGFYGDPASPAALGMQVAINEINSTGPFTGADGRAYRFVGLASQDIALLQQAVLLFVTPESPAVEQAVSLPMPIFMLSAEADLEIEGLQGAYYRAMTSLAVQQSALADTLNRFGAGQTVLMIGDETGYSDLFSEFSAALPSATVQTIGADLPELDSLTQALASNPTVIIYYGSEANAGAILSALESSGWAGLLVYPNAYEAAQAGLLTPSASIQVLGMTPWANSAKDSLSQIFRQTYITQTGQIPSAEAVSTYDITWAMRVLVGRLGGDAATLASRLPTTDVINTTQGQIAPGEYGGRDLYQSVQVYALQPLGGMDVLARYDAGVYLGVEESLANLPTATPLPSATPSQAVVRVKSQTLNVRTGPGENYPRIGSLSRGDEALVQGAMPDFTWFFVQTNAGLGWVKGEFVDLFNPLGGVTGISPVQIPPTPTPGPTFTAVAPPDVIIESVVLNPTRLTIGQAFSATVTVRNNADSPATAFTVAANWLPDNIQTSAPVPSLAAFTSVSVVLQATLNQAGNPTINVVADANGQVVESNESNNTFSLTYVVDAPPTIATQNVYGVNQLNFAGNLTDMDWTGVALNSLNGATFGLITGVSYDNITINLLTPANLTNNTVGTLAAGTVFGMRTGEGHCGVFRIDNVVGANITFTFRMYDASNCPD
jgi:ABC-type branched-subunit amino acid transport system substrate-binding protein